MGHIIADITENSSTKYGCRCIPIVEEHSMRQLPEWRRKYNEQCWWHDKAIAIHGKVVVNAMEEEVQRDTNAIVWEMVVKMEEAAMQAVFY